MKYSTGFRNNIIKQVLPPENKSISKVSIESGVSEQTIRNWIFKLKAGNLDPIEGEVSPLQRSPTEKMSLLLESKKLQDDELGQWLRKNGLHSEHLALWEQELREVVTDNSQKDKKTILDQKKKIKALEKELNRKEKALAEMAALMTLKKKADAIWGEEEDD